MITITTNIGPVYPIVPTNPVANLLQGYPFPKGNNLRGYNFFSGTIILHGGESTTVDEKILAKAQLKDIIAGFASGKLVSDTATLAIVKDRLNSISTGGIGGVIDIAAEPYDFTITSAGDFTGTLPSMIDLTQEYSLYINGLRQTQTEYTVTGTTLSIPGSLIWP
jgi:hypothetical protein